VADHPMGDPTFSPHRYGCRPGRSAHQAIAQAQQYIAQGDRWVVEMDLEKFFDRVNQDQLMGQSAKRVQDKRVLTLIRAFLDAGVLTGGLVEPTAQGVPQGGPLTPPTNLQPFFSGANSSGYGSSRHTTCT
jgi:RNA-directed DNA polymerase